MRSTAYTLLFGCFGAFIWYSSIYVNILINTCITHYFIPSHYSFPSFSSYWLYQILSLGKTMTAPLEQSNLTVSNLQIRSITLCFKTIIIWIEEWLQHTCMFSVSENWCIWAVSWENLGGSKQEHKLDIQTWLFFPICKTGFFTFHILQLSIEIVVFELIIQTGFLEWW